MEGRGADRNGEDGNGLERIGKDRYGSAGGERGVMETNNTGARRFYLEPKKQKPVKYPAIKLE